MDNAHLHSQAITSPDRTLAILDGVYLYRLSTALDFQIDLEKMRNWLQSTYPVFRIAYYTLRREGADGTDPLRRMLDWMSYNGFDVRTFDSRRTLDDDGKEHFRGNYRVPLTIEAMKAFPRIGHLFLASGDYDLTDLVIEAKDQGIRVTYLSSLKTNPPLVCNDIRREADAFVDLADMRDLWRKDGVGKARKAQEAA